MNQKNSKIFYQNLLRIIREGRKAMLPPPDLTVSEWAEQDRMLPETVNEPGKYRVKRTPHVKRIQDSFSDPVVEEITMMGSAQIAKTTILENCIGYTIAINPQPMLFMAPTLDVAKAFSKDKLEPMIELTRSLTDKVSKRKSRDSDNTVLYKKFIGGFIVFVGANSPHGLRQRSIPIIFTDDIDSIEVNSTKEGDPVLRAEKRSQTFEGRRKKVRASTPTREGASRIWSFYQMGTMEQFYIPCIHCNHYQVLKWENVTWDFDKDVFGKKIKGTDRLSTVRIACGECGTLITEQERMEMLQSGQWRAEHPERVTHRSFWINEISSSLSSLQQVVKAYLATEDDPEKEETFINLVLGRPYKPKDIDEIDELGLLNRVESYLDPAEPLVCPDEVFFLVAATDVHKDRLECEIWAVGFQKELWIVQKHKLYGDPKSKHIWNQHDKIVGQKFVNQQNDHLKILVKFIDSGYLSQEVYDYCRGRELSNGFWPIKGARQPLAPILPSQWNWVDNKRTRSITIGVNKTKEYIFERLKLTEAGPRFIHFDQSICDHEYFEQLTAEHGVKKPYSGIEIMHYVKKTSTARNEALDLLVYVVAAVEYVNPNWETLKKKAEMRKSKPEEKTVPVKETVKQEQQQLNKPKPVVNKKPKYINSITNW